MTESISTENLTSTAPPPVASVFTDTQVTAVKVSLIVISVLTIIGNSMVILFVALKPRLQTKTNAMVVSLAVSDLIVGLFLMPSFFSCFYVKCDDVLTKICYDVFLFTSVLNLCCITIDRFLAVTRPLKYQMRMNRRTVTIMIIISWVIPAITQLLPAAWYYTDTGIETVKLNNKIFYTVQVVVFMFLPCFVMGVAYMVIFNIAWKHSRYIRHVVSNLSLTSDNSTTSANSGVSQSTIREARATIKVFGTVLLVFICCWILSAFRTIVTNYELMQLNPHLIMASRMFLVTNSAINPIIYAFWKRDIKQEVQRLLGLTKRGVRPSSSAFPTSNNYSQNNGGLTRHTSYLGSRQDVSLSEQRKSGNTTAAQTPKLVQVAMAETAMEEIQEGKQNDTVLELKNEKEENDSPVELKNENEEEDSAVESKNIKEGIDNPAADDVDGMV